LVLILLNFEKRDIVLIVGLLLFMIGLVPFMAPVYAALITIVMYFGIKFYVAKRRKSIEKDIGEGICVDCGSKVFNKKCPNCDSIGE
jgi:flagellar biosynthesis component FlhA